jgi:N-acetylglucosaminyldiphosphoundecaprenol N-acetyl-beta-D-mannosaminyltransferase
MVPRAPEMISTMGVEWLYRLAMEPKRLWKRYLINDLPFIWLLLKQKMLG